MAAKTSETLATDKTSHTSGASAAKSKRTESSTIKEVPPKGKSQFKTVPMTEQSTILNAEIDDLSQIWISRRILLFFRRTIFYY